MLHHDTDVGELIKALKKHNGPVYVPVVINGDIDLNVKIVKADLLYLLQDVDKEAPAYYYVAGIADPEMYITCTST